MSDRKRQRLFAAGSAISAILLPLLFSAGNAASAARVVSPAAPYSHSESQSAARTTVDPQGSDPARSAIEPARRDSLLPKGWRASKDIAVTTAGDATGFHVLAAEASKGYQWHTLATLSEPGVDTDQWVGNACLTGSGRDVVAVYAPRHFTNRPWLFSRGAFAAVIDVKTGAVTKLNDQVSLAYFNPGCGLGDTVALTQGTIEERNSTRLLVVDTATKRKTRTTVVSGQITSAIPVGESVVASPHRLVEVTADGKLETLTATSSLPYELHPTADGGVAFTEYSGGVMRVRQYRQGTTHELASGRLGELSVRSGTQGRVFLLGKAQRRHSLPQKMSLVETSLGPAVSSEGGLLIRTASRHGLNEGRRGDPADTDIVGTSGDTSGSEPVDVTAHVTATKAEVEFEVNPDAQPAPEASSGRVANPRLARIRPATSSLNATATGTVDQGYTCAVPRNDPKVQVYQPHWRQVEWAVDQLVFKNRLSLTRPANWKGSGVPAWNPQALFPLPDLVGGGRMPVSIMLGILAQESNLWQAQRNVLEGETGNPLVGNYYGFNLYDTNPANDWEVDFSDADCGYGITQQTDNMRKSGSAWDADKQRRVAFDYVTNIAAGMQTLASKWNEVLTDTAGQAKVNNGDPAKIENWYMAVWAYNSGWHPKSAAWGNDDKGQPNNGAWGLGWANNPANGDYRPGRLPFLNNNSYSDAAHPQDWPYQEKVLGWSAWPITKTYYDATTQKWETEGGYNLASWNSDLYRGRIVPTALNSPMVDLNAFCAPPTPGNDNHNNCQPPDPSAGNLAGTCLRADYKCWWHLPKAWKSCPVECGNEAYLRYDDTWYNRERAEPTDQWTPCLTPGLPPKTGDTTNVLIVDDLSRSDPPIRGGCDNSGWANSGTLSFEFGQDASGKVPARADFQQLGNGFGGHEWFGYTRTAARNGDVMKVTGTWELNQAVNGWARVLVHVPKRRAETQQAPYTVHLGNGVSETRYLSQGREQNSWQNLGVFQFAGTPKVSLSNLNREGDGTAAVAWDAVAFQILAKKPKHFVVGMGDSFASGEGAGNYYPETDTAYKSVRWNACRRSKDAWIRQTVLPGETQTVGQLADSFDPKLDFAFVACSGAVTRDMTVPEYQYTGVPVGDWSTYRGRAEGRFREAAQLESGFLNKDTTLVAFSIGGNDASFSDIVATCYLISCYSGSYENDIKSDVTHAINDRQDQGEAANVRNILNQVNAKVENGLAGRGKKAKIVLMGYPEVAGIGTACPAFDDEEKQMFQRITDHFSSEENKLVQAVKATGLEVSFANPLPTFQGHGSCGSMDTTLERWVNYVDFTKTGPGDFQDVVDGCIGDGARCASRASLHPNKKGAEAYSRVFGEHLADPTVNYTGW